MNEVERLGAIEEIRQLKARYWRGVDTGDAEMVRATLAEDCLLDFRGCWTEPATGLDLMPRMNVVMEGRESWQALIGLSTVHQGHQHEIAITGPATATGIWVFSDRLFFRPGRRIERLTGFGYYHDTYEKADGRWLVKTSRVSRLHVEAKQAEGFNPPATG